MSTLSEPTYPAGSESRSRRPRETPGAGHGFGTFGGVFTPCTLTILGVIMFLRYGYVVGNAGLWTALLILAAAKAITTVTALSLSAVATNTRVEGGGAYFLISRSLGVEFGGAIGVVFFFAQAISVSMYVMGFAEAFAAAFGGSSVDLRVVGLLTNLAIFACVFVGAGWTIRVQYVILGALIAALLAFFLGAGMAFSMETLRENLRPHYAGNESFFTMFALFFPAVTGIMAGANMSGDLRSPERSIPRGTLWAIAVTGLIYALMAVALAGSALPEALATQTMIVADVSVWPALITVGVFAATLSSALGSMMGAPRILQALARDNVFESLTPFARGSGDSGEPRRAVVVTFLISTACIIVADLNTIAPLITMAFMITYGMINLATFYEGIARNPSYRPTFRYSHWIISLLGAAGCLFVMAMLNWRWAILAAGIMASIYFLIYRRQVESRWGDLSSGLLLERTRKNLLRLERSLYHPKNWRPILLAMTGSSGSRLHLTVLGHWLTSGHGILSLGQVIQGDFEGRVPRIASQEAILQKFIVDEDIDAFPNVVAAPTLTEGIEYLIQCSGIGALKPNTLLLGWPTSTEKAEALVSSLRVIASLKRNVIMARFAELPREPRRAPEGTIDVWWRGRQNGELMLLLAHLLRQNPQWRSRTIRLMRVVTDEAGREEVLHHLETLARTSRIRVDCQVIVSDDAVEAIRVESRYAAIVFLGFEMPKEGDEGKFFHKMNALAEGIPRVLFVNSIGNMTLDS